jgi:hypothetical protein
MLKLPLLLILLLLINSILFAQLSKEDYKVYAAIIKTEISDTTKSVAIMKRGIHDREKRQKICNTVDQLTSKKLSDKYQVYFLTENSKNERPSIIDSISTQFLINYCNSTAHNFIFEEDLNQPYKTILLNKFPIRQKSIEKGWKNFYKKYPGSGGVFSFSKISYYTKNKITAIFYYWVKHNGLNGHGAIAIMEKINGEWQMKYKSYLWWA